MIEASEEDIARFMSFVEKLPNGCWFWSGARSRGKGNKKWYGSFRVKGKVVRAHRFSCEVLGKRECPSEHHRDHTCQFSLCVNPDHIEVVPREENQRRKQERNLMTFPCSNCGGDTQVLETRVEMRLRKCKDCGCKFYTQEVEYHYSTKEKKLAALKRIDYEIRKEGRNGKGKELEEDHLS